MEITPPVSLAIGLGMAALRYRVPAIWPPLATTAAVACFAFVFLDGSQANNGLALSLAFNVGAAAGLMDGLMSLRAPKQQTKAEFPTVASPPIQPGIKPADAPAREASRVFLRETVTPQYLCRIYQERTKLQADQAAASYLGKWLKLTGTVHDVSTQPEGKVFVNVDHPGPPGTGPYDEIIIVLLIFTEGDGRLEVLHKGDPITAIGRINRISNDALVLEECELLAE